MAQTCGFNAYANDGGICNVVTPGPELGAVEVDGVPHTMMTVLEHPWAPRSQYNIRPTKYVSGICIASEFSALAFVPKAVVRRPRAATIQSSVVCVQRSPLLGRATAAPY